MVERKAPYERLISETLVKLTRAPIDPRHVEAYMRADHGTLDALSPARFAGSVAAAVAQIEIYGTHAAERLAMSFGL